MECVGFDEGEVNDVLCVLASILHIGNLEFELHGETAKITNRKVCCAEPCACCQSWSLL